MGVLYARETPQDNFTPVSTMGVGNASQSQRGLMTAQDKVKLDGIADYIVEQGTSGIWAYRKWNSGIAECWGTHEENMIINTQTSISGLYYKSFDLNLPTGLFNAIPKLNGTLYSISGGFITGNVPTTPNVFPLYLCSIGTPQNVPTKLDFHAIGTWK